MNRSNETHRELAELLEAVCEERMTSQQAARLEQVVLNDAAALRRYLEYVDLHGTLYWDTAKGSEERTGVADVRSAEEAAAVSVLKATHPVSGRSRSGTEAACGEPARPGRRLSRLKGRYWVAGLTAVVTAAVLLAWAVLGPWFPSPIGGNMAGSDGPSQRGPAAQQPGPNGEHLGTEPRSPRPSDDATEIPRLNVRLSQHSSRKDTQGTSEARPGDTESASHPPQDVVIPDGGSSAAEIVAFIDDQIRAGWDAANIKPSSVAEDSEWIRRVYLDVVGHIPPVEVVEDFLQDRNPNKRSLLIDRLLADPDYVHNWTTIWTNLLVGRSSSRNVDRPALEKFLRTGFARNRPWSDIVYDVVSAEGDPNQHGEANFLVAHLNNQAVPATAITARLFLGLQVQCTQCHDHPFNDWTQNQFWELNSFFKQTGVATHQRHDPNTGNMLTDVELVSRPVGGPIEFETRQGLMKVAYPKFAGQKIDPGADVNRRQELARLMTQGDDPLIAQAFVNRLWAHFFGYGFTRPVDDMGPHNPPTHPELLRRLSREFVASGYDVKQLIHWICSSETYQLTSRFNDANHADDPATGIPPLFSRVYVKSMTAEQLYDSLLIATKAQYAGRANWSEVEQQRQQWLQQFVIAFQTDEDDEATSFDGTIPQALLMMNSQLVERALDPAQGTVLHHVITQRSGEVDKIKQLCLAALSREPTTKELAAFRKLLRERSGARSSAAPGRPAPRDALVDGLQDVFWAYLNSNEFILIH